MLWDEVADGCFRRRYRAFDLNIGVVRGSDALLVVDTRADLRQADELLDDLRVFGQPVRWVVNSHWHFDHVFGNQRFVERSRGERVAVGADVSADLEFWGHIDVPRLWLDDEAGYRALLREIYGDAAGDEYDRVTLTLPDHLVADRHALDLGDRGVELTHVGLGHTSNDLVVVVPESGVIFAGDLFEESAPPAYGDDCYPLAWPATADALLAMGASVFVPGHGDLMPAHAAHEQANEIAIVASLIRELHAAGVSVEDALHEGRERWPFPPEALGDAVQRGYETLLD